MKEFEIELNNGINIPPRLSEATVSKMEGVHPGDIGNGNVWYWLPENEIDGLKIIFGFCFNIGVLKSINVSISNPEIYGGSWDDFDEAQEKRRAKDTENWLGSRGYAVGNYPWGSVWAGYEGKGGFGQSVVRFIS
ncbi:hypothetical protein [Teredinibacter waterburyi]|uniref:hypothetical protein n=1 Tax=Teredinibacter waterburyi TaxID=1500538 RepID=UPI00165F5CE6|nr:hypothetical protein [Teredinibacter waterburyi]